jgi:hypothetical protein
METIIQQITSNMAINVMEHLSKGGIKSIGQDAEPLLKISNEAVLGIIQAVIESLDQALQNEKGLRKEDGWRIKEKNVKRTILLQIGELEYRRTYFENVNTGERAYLADELIGVEKSSRMTRDIEVKLVENSSEMSYEKSSKVSINGRLSRQTVKNKIHNTKEVAYVPSPKEDTPEELHILADEDHVNMQSGKDVNVNLITACEGTKAVCKGRNELINPLHFEGYKLSPETHWEYVSATLSEVYDMEKVKKIYVHGDGAGWIKTATTFFPQAIHVMDRYHLNKAVIKLAADYPEENLRLKIWQSLRHNSQDELMAVVDKKLKRIEKVYEDESARNKKVKALNKIVAYFSNNWESMRRRLHLNVMGSCTEPMISHILSERLSRNPMGWSQNGLSQMAMIRVYMKNGGRINIGDVRAREEERKVVNRISVYEDIVEKQLAEATKGFKNWALCDARDSLSYSTSKTTGTSVLVRSSLQMKDVG